MRRLQSFKRLVQLLQSALSRPHLTSGKVCSRAILNLRHLPQPERPGWIGSKLVALFQPFQPSLRPIIVTLTFTEWLHDELEQVLRL
jgi:hypothetical protein